MEHYSNERIQTMKGNDKKFTVVPAEPAPSSPW